MERNNFCPLCGVDLLMNSRILDEIPSVETRARPWYGEVRGIHLSKFPYGPVSVTGVGIIQSTNTLSAPFDINLSYTEVAIEKLENWKICQPFESRWCYGIHDRIGLFPALLYSLPRFLLFQFGHDYGGAAEVRRSYSLLRGEDLITYYYADPFAIPSLDDIEVASLHTFGSTNYWRPVSVSGGAIDEKHENGRTYKQNVFDRLPTELKFEIFSYISFDDLMSLRLVCQSFALLATVNTLPQSYWHNRFFPGQEADFIFPGLQDRRDWARIFLWVRASLRTGLFPLINRNRIRQLIEPIAVLMERMAASKKGPNGFPFHKMQNRGGYVQLCDYKGAGKPSELIKESGHFSGQIASLDGCTPLNEGCRECRRVAQPFICPCLYQSDWYQIGISTVQVGPRMFISGINLCLSGKCNTLDRSIGYRFPSSEKSIELPSSSHIEALCVAFCPEGLRGINFILANSDSSGWIGDSDDPEIAYGILRIPEGTLDRYFMLAGLDRFKIVSLGLGKLTSDVDAPASCPSQDVTGSFCVQSQLWVSHPPNHMDSSISSFLPKMPPRRFEPRINIDFGGQGGLLLRSLTRLVFHMSATPYPLNGVELFYTDGKSVLSGSRSDCELSFFVNGPGGEYIKHVAVLQDDQEHLSSTGLSGLKVTTNYGRTATFAPLHSRLRASVKPIPNMPKNIITGFVAHNAASGNENRFIQVAIQSQQYDGEQPTVPHAVNHERHQIPEVEIRHDYKFSTSMEYINNGTYQTYASLENVRKIHASIGANGRSRSPNQICGLKFEYYDHPSPSIIGQWIHGLDDDGFEMSPNEKIDLISIWFSGCRGTRGRQVVEIHIETTHFRSVIFHSPADNRNTSPRWLECQYQRGIGEELTAISWILNVFCDLVRSVISKTGSQKVHIFIPEITTPFNDKQKFYFEIQNEDNNHNEIMVAIEAYSRDQIIIGLIFVYSSDRRAICGHFENATTRQTLRFSQNSRIIGLSSTRENLELKQLEFEIEQNEPPHYTKKLTLSSVPLNVSSGNMRRGSKDVCCRDAESAKNYINSSGRVYRPPSKSRLVGIYVRCQLVRYIGAIYEPVHIGREHSPESQLEISRGHPPHARYRVR